MGNGASGRGLLPLLCRSLAAGLLGVAFAAPAASAYDAGVAASTPIRKLTIEGNRALDADEIRDHMLHSRGGWIRSGRYRPRWLDQDIELVLTHYASLGFLDVRIAEKDVRWSGDRRSVDIRIRIEEGEPTVVGSVAFDGLPKVPEGEIRSKLALLEGKPYNRDLLSRDRSRIAIALSDSGYAEAVVDADEKIDGGRAALLYRITPGPRVRIGPIAVAGAVATKERFVRRELLFHEGDWYRRSSLLESRDRIYQTGLYSNVAITREAIDSSAAVPIRIEVTEKRVRSFGFGGGFGTEDRFRASVDWSNRNVLGSGRRLSVEAVLSDLYSDRPFEQKYEVSLIEPWVLGTRTVGLWKLSHERYNVENFIIKEEGAEDRIVGRYRLNETAASFSLSRDFSRIMKGWITYSLEWADAGDASEPIDPKLLEPDVTRSLAVSVERDARDHLIDPSRGTREHGSLEFAGSFLGGDNEFVRGIAGGAAYRPAWGRYVFAARAQVGALRSLSDAGAVPDYKLFRLGGANDVRGYREESIGPGYYLLLASAEVRFRLFWRFGGVLFVDGGNAWDRLGVVKGRSFRVTADREEVGAADFRYGVGGGLRLYTPVGPLRLDYAQKLKRAVDATGVLESAGAFHFSIGQAF